MIPKQLRYEGVCYLPSIDQWFTDRMNEYFLASESLLTGGHVPRFADGVDAHVGCYPYSVSVNAPGLLKLYLSYAPWAREYFFGEEPVLYSVNTYWTFPGGNFRLDIHDWHRDVDDRKQLAIFLALTPIDRGSAHVYSKRRRPRDKREMYGPAGTLWVENPEGWHYARQPKHIGRCLSWGRYGVSDPPRGYISDGIEPVKYLANDLTAEEKRIARLIVK